MQFHQNRNPTQVYRIEAYLKYLSPHTYKYNWLIGYKDDIVFYKGNFLQKIILIIKFTFRRVKQIFNPQYKTAIICRECYPLGTTFFETIIKKFLKKRLVFDIDDAVWLPVISEGNKQYKFLKSYTKYAKIMQMADVVIAGNNFLANYAKQYNKNVHIIPSCIDLDLYTPTPFAEKENNKICIGWSGSETTLSHLLLLKNVFVTIQNKYKEKVYFKIISNKKNFNIEGVNLKCVQWTKQNEVSELKEFDIGVMPLPNTAWSKGKCSMKGIQYMGLNIATIMTNIGTNKEVIQHEQNGLLANTEAEWIQYLSMLIDNKQLREKLGNAGRKTVEEKYAIQVWKDKWITLINE